MSVSVSHERVVCFREKHAIYALSRRYIVKILTFNVRILLIVPAIDDIKSIFSICHLPLDVVFHWMSSSFHTFVHSGLIPLA